MYKRRANTWHEYADFILLELLCMNISFVVAYCIRHGWSVLPYTVADYLFLIGITSLFDVIIAVFFNAFGGVLKKGFYKEFMSSLKHVLMVFAAVTLCLFALQESATYSRISLFLMFGFDLVLGYFSRIIYKRTRRARVTHQRSILVLSEKSEFERIKDGFKDDHDNGIVICGCVDIDADSSDEVNINNVVEYVCRQWVDEIFIDIPDKADAGLSEKIRDMILKFNEMGVTVHSVIKDFDTLEGQQIVETLAGKTVVTSSIRIATPGQLLIKRLMDIVGGMIGCLLTIVIGIVIAPIILIKSPGPLFFKQVRIGLNGKKFKMLKFRSMVLNADAKKAELMEQNTISGDMMFKLDWDPRIIGNRITSDGKKKTGIGEFIRRTSLDEFPQFFNVLIGDMSLVGTRPPTVDEWEKYDLHHRARLSVRPGITGMWQVSGRSNITDFEEVVKLDTEYIYNWSIGMDLRILVRTIGAVFKGRGAK